MALPSVLYFEIYRDGELLGTEQSDQSAIKIGSHPKSHLFVDDPEVSRVHAMVEKSAQGVFVIDLGSGRGTFVNGERVNKRQLQHGDRIRLGGTEIVFMTHDEKAVAAAEHRRKRAIDPRTNRPRDLVLYSRRFLAKPAATDGSVEVALLWRDYVMAEELYKPPKDLVIGDSKGADFQIEHPAIGESLTVVSTAGGQPVLQFPPGIDGEVYVGSERMSLAEAVSSGRATKAGAVAALPFTDETRAKLVFGDVSLFLHRTTRPKVVLPFERRTIAPLLFLLFSAGLHALLWLLIMFLPPGIGDLSLDSFGAQDRFVQILIQDAQPEPEEVVAEDEGEDEDQGEDEDEGELLAGDEGRAGLETEEDEQLRMAIEGDLEPGEIELARQAAMMEVQDRGALAVLNQQSMGPASLFGAGPSGSDAIMAIGAVQGDSQGASYGSRGLGAYGGGLSGGGRHTGSLRGTGGITALRGRSTGGSDSDLGRSMRTVSDRDTLRPTVVVGTPEVRGQLDREIIQRVIREHRREIRACYEGELQRNTSLEGRVVVAFVISPDGAVAGSRITESSLNNSAVENCVATRVRQWRFPEPRGGGTVNVNYPFVFSPSG